MITAQQVTVSVLGAAGVIVLGFGAAEAPAGSADGAEPSEVAVPGQVVTIAGTGSPGSPPDGTPALEADLDDRMGVAVGRDGTVYIADTYAESVRTVGTDGLLGSVPELSGDEVGDGEGYGHLWAVAVGVDGSLYAATGDGIGVRRPDGRVETLADGQFAAQDVAVGANGTVYVADLRNKLIRAVDPSGAVTILAGSTGDPRGIAVDSSGAVYFTDTTSVSGGYRSAIRRIDPAGEVTTVVGEKGNGFGGDGGPATEAQVSNLLGGLAMGPDDTLYIADTGNHAVRAVGTDGVITTMAPVMPSLSEPASLLPYSFNVQDVAVGPDGNLYVAVGGLVRMLVPGSPAEHLGEPETEDDQAAYDDPYADEEPGAVVTVAGSDGELDRPLRVTVDDAGGLYVVLHEVRGRAGLVRIDDDGTPQPVTSGPGGAPLIGVRAAEPGRNGVVHVSSAAGLETLFPDGSKVRLTGGIGSGSGQAFGDGVPATTAYGSNWDLALGPAGLYFGDNLAQTVYIVEPDGTMGSAGTNVNVHLAGGLDVADDGTVYVAERALDQVTEIDPDGSSRVLAGNGESSWTRGEIGDGGPAAEAVLAAPIDVALHSDGTAYVSSFHGIRRVGAEGIIETVLVSADEGDGDVAQSVTSLDLDAHGNLYFVESDTGLVRVLVRPGEMSGPSASAPDAGGGSRAFPWAVVAGGAGGIAVLGVGWFLVRRRRTHSSDSEGTE